MSTTTTAPSGVDIAEAQRKYEAIFGPDGFLRHHNVERNEEIELLGLSIIAGVDPLFLGEPGVGKTWVIELLFDHCLTDMALFQILLAKDMSADEVLGPRDVTAMKRGEIARLTDGFLPTAHGGYLDEVFKSSPPLLNPLLDITANRKLKVGGKVLDCGQLLVVAMSSNELPDREDLQAFRDRIGITKFVKPVRTPEGRREVTDIQLDYQAQGITDAPERLSLDDIYALKHAATQVTVPDAVRQVMVDMQGKLQEAGHPPSQRRIGQAWKVAKTRTLVRGGSEMTVDDFLPAQHMFWNHPDHSATAREIVLDVASVFTRKAARLREAMEPVVAELESLRQKIDAASDEAEKDDLVGESWTALRQLKRLRKDANEQVREGKAQGQDVTMTEAVIGDIDKAEAWVEKAITGDDIEEN